MYEEINTMSRHSLGQDFGWPAYEGERCIADLTPAEDCVEPSVGPVVATAHPEAGTIIGGSVYGGSVDALHGHYIYGDYITGRVRSAVIRGTDVSDQHDLTSQLRLHRTLASIDVDSRGEMYLVNVFKGTIHRIVPAN